MTYTPVGIEFGGEIPSTWFPGNRRHVSIKLSRSALTDLNRALFQLSHEVVHLLAPTGGRQPLVIEEGLATLFSRIKSDALGLEITPEERNYLDAEELVAELLSQLGPDAILRIRQIEPCFAAMTPELLQGLGVQEKLAGALCEKFSYV